MFNCFLSRSMLTYPSSMIVTNRSCCMLLSFLFIRVWWAYVIDTPDGSKTDFLSVELLEGLGVSFLLLSIILQGHVLWLGYSGRMLIRSLQRETIQRQ